VDSLGCNSAASCFAKTDTLEFSSDHFLMTTVPSKSNLAVTR
jgi:hypothetical protein